MSTSFKKELHVYKENDENGTNNIWSTSQMQSHLWVRTKKHGNT